MKTIYQYKPTAEEIIKIMGKLWREEDYLRVVSVPQSAYIDIWKLFLYRRDYYNAKKCLRKIKNELIRTELMNIDYES